MKLWISAFVMVFLVSACNLDIEETDSIITEEAEGVFAGVEDPTSSVNDLYNSIYGQLGDQANFFALNEVSTDETLVPTRGTDWGDNGIWRTLHAHTWTPAHAYVLNVWNNLNQNIIRATEVIDPLSGATAGQVADAKFVRAYSMFHVLSLYGQVPFREPSEDASVNPRVLSRQEAYDLILSDVNDAIADLPADGPGATTNRGTRAGANYLKAELLLNAHIFTETGSPSNSDMQGVIDAVDAIEADGFALQAGYFALFEPSVDNETIWFAETSVGNRIWNGLHYNQNAPENGGGGWNGFSTLAEFYDSFDGPTEDNTLGVGQEERRGWVPDATTASVDNLGIGYGFLIGQQYEEDGTQLTDRAGAPLIFKRIMPGLIGNDEQTGVRIIKYHPSNDSFVSHEIVFRFGGAHLMRAEAMLRMGNSGDALTEVNELRTLRGAATLGSLSETEMLAERGRELYVEFVRRNDMIRFGQFTRDWDFKDPASVDDVTKNLYPIPSNALLSNPNLNQNPGY